MLLPEIFRPSRKKIIILIALLLSGFLLFNRFSKPKTEVLQFAEVKRADIASIVSSSGTLTGKDVVNLKFKNPGKVSYVNVKEGDQVDKGQVIAGLDTQQLSIELQQAQNVLRDKQAIAEKVEDDVKNNDDDETYAQRATRTTAQVARDNAYDAVKEAQRALQDAVIVSPVAGIVTEVNVVAGQVVSSDIIATIADFSSFYFDTDVDESDISKVGVGTPTDVHLDAYPDQKFSGFVDQIIPQTKTTSSGATVVTVRIILDNPALVFVNGLSGESSIITETSLDTLVIPQEALKDNETVVLQTKDGLKDQKVVTGLKSDIEVEIKQGLSEGDKVVLNPK